MAIQKQINNGIPIGFGQRLKEERKRLGYSQESFAEIGGVQRLAQIQYENENTSPTTRYLNLISNVGADITYLLLGSVQKSTEIPFNRMEAIEDKTFDLIEKFAESTGSSKFSTETFQMLFKLIRGILIQVEEGKLSNDIDILSMVSNGKM